MYILIIAAVIVLDRLTKVLAVKYLYGIDTLPLIKNVLHLTYTENTGAAFSVFTGKAVYLAIFSAVVAAALCFFLFRETKKNPQCRLYTASIAAIIGGAVGNMIDRFAYGYVIDFVDFRLINFAVFNIADAFLTVATVVLCACILFDKRIQL